ncbi:hypothetical protein V7149_03315, partial [Bacillus sp. JJ1503]|uniref:hypothetical protein n=1 Tax=Bacillus sp. JJ1503 TaxID=3122956 RepID=UPI002FFF94D3
PSQNVRPALLLGLSRTTPSQNVLPAITAWTFKNYSLSKCPSCISAWTFQEPLPLKMSVQHFWLE